MSRLRRKGITPLATLAAVAVLTAGPINTKLRTETVQAWDAYVAAADARMEALRDPQTPFLWVDESPARKVRVRRGEIVVQPAAAHGTVKAPDGLIHDWIGAVFIPDATLDSILEVVHDYDRYKDFFAPTVVASQRVEFTAASQEFSMRWRVKAPLVTAVIDGDYQAHDLALDGRRGYSISRSTRMQEIQDYGTAEERLLPVGTGHGFLWAIHSITRYEERDGGVFLELEAIALSRDIPFSVRLLVNPIVNHLSISGLTSTLAQTRDAVAAASSNHQ